MWDSSGSEPFDADITAKRFSLGAYKNMACFQVIDLMSQRDAIKEHLKGKSENEKLSWLSSKGDVLKLPKNDENMKQVYQFTSGLGNVALFFFDENEIIFIGDHHTFR